MTSDLTHSSAFFLTRIMLKIADIAPESPRLRADRGKSADALARFRRPKALYHPKQHLTVLERLTSDAFYWDSVSSLYRRFLAKYREFQSRRAGSLLRAVVMYADASAVYLPTQNRLTRLYIGSEGP